MFPDIENNKFSEFYAANHDLLEDAKNSFLTLINALLNHNESIAISKIEGRVKTREECIKKYNIKYKNLFPSSSKPLSIRACINDLIGLRVVCLYEDEIERIEEILSEHFIVINKTDKITQIENTEGSFGYKGLHLDLQLSENRRFLPEYEKYAEFRFELQIRTIIQDSWSVLDHKIKYKRSIPPGLKRRINTLAALFELADREFREIRDATNKEIENEIISDNTLQEETDAIEISIPIGKNPAQSNKLNVFSFQRIANHFFKGFNFDAHKVDEFTQEIVDHHPTISRAKFNLHMRENISRVKKYQSTYNISEIDENIINPYQTIRHCLYLGDNTIFDNILSAEAKAKFNKWRSDNGLL